LRYLTVKNSDFTSSDEAIDMLRALLPPQALQAEGNEQIPPQALAKIQQMMQQMQMAQAEMQKLQQENVQLKSGAQVKQIQIVADSEAEDKKLALERAVQDERQRLAREQFEFDRQLELEKAQHAAMMDESKFKAEQDKRTMEQNAALEARAREEQAPLIENAIPAFVDALQNVTQTFAQVMAKSEEKDDAEDRAMKQISFTLPDGRSASAVVRTVQ
jgi:hypothetical protein